MSKLTRRRLFRRLAAVPFAAVAGIAAVKTGRKTK